MNSKVDNRHFLLPSSPIGLLPSATYFYAWARHEPTLPAALNDCLTPYILSLIKACRVTRVVQCFLYFQVQLLKPTSVFCRVVAPPKVIVDSGPTKWKIEGSLSLRMMSVLFFLSSCELYEFQDMKENCSVFRACTRIGHSVAPSFAKTICLNVSFVFAYA